MAKFEKGKPRPKNAGRRKGTPNKVTITVKEALEEAFEEVGAKDYLVQMAFQEPKAFMALVAKVIPTKLEAEVSVTVREIEQRLAKGRERLASAPPPAPVINQKRGSDHVH